MAIAPTSIWDRLTSKKTRTLVELTPIADRVERERAAARVRDVLAMLDTEAASYRQEGAEEQRRDE